LSQRAAHATFDVIFAAFDIDVYADYHGAVTMPVFATHDYVIAARPFVGATLRADERLRAAMPPRC